MIFELSLGLPPTHTSMYGHCKDGQQQGSIPGAWINSLGRSGIFFEPDREFFRAGSGRSGFFFEPDRAGPAFFSRTGPVRILSSSRTGPVRKFFRAGRLTARQADTKPGWKSLLIDFLDSEKSLIDFGKRTPDFYHFFIAFLLLFYYSASTSLVLDLPIILQNRKGGVVNKK